MVISKNNINSVIIIIASVLTLYTITINNSYSKNEAFTKTFNYESEQRTYLLKSLKKINLKFNFKWNICANSKLLGYSERLKRQAGGLITSSFVDSEIIYRAALSKDFSTLNTTKNILRIIRKSNEILEERGLCIKNLSLRAENGI